MPFRCHPLRLCECRCRPLQLLRPLFQLNSILLFQFSSMSLGCAPLRCFVAICFSSSNQSKSLVLLPISSSFTFYFLLSVIYMSFFSSLYTAPFCLPRLPTQPCFMRSAPLGHSHVPRQRLTVSVFLCLPSGGLSFFYFHHSCVRRHVLPPSPLQPVGLSDSFRRATRTAGRFHSPFVPYLCILRLWVLFTYNR